MHRCNSPATLQLNCSSLYILLQLTYTWLQQALHIVASNRTPFAAATHLQLSLYIAATNWYMAAIGAAHRRKQQRFRTPLAREGPRRLLSAYSVWGLGSRIWVSWCRVEGGLDFSEKGTIFYWVYKVWGLGSRDYGSGFASARGLAGRLVLHLLEKDSTTHCNTLQQTTTNTTCRFAPCLCTTTHFDTLQHTATHCNTLQHTATHCNLLFCALSSHNNVLQHTTTHCNALQRTATHYNTLQHTATHCNHTLQQRTTRCNLLFCALSSHNNISQTTTTHRNTLQHTATHNNFLFRALSSLYFECKRLF